MQIVLVKDLKAAMKNRHSKEYFNDMMENASKICGQIRRGKESGIMLDIPQYVRVPKVYDREDFEQVCSDEQDVCLILIVFWICAFSRKFSRLKVDTLAKTMDLPGDYIKTMVETYGAQYGLRKFRGRTSNGQTFDFIGFRDPRSADLIDTQNFF